MPYQTKARKLSVPVLHDANDCIETTCVCVAKGLLPFFFAFFDKMKSKGPWIADCYENAKRYWEWQEVQFMLHSCNDNQEMLVLLAKLLNLKPSIGLGFALPKTNEALYAAEQADMLNTLVDVPNMQEVRNLRINIGYDGIADSTLENALGFNGTPVIGHSLAAKLEECILVAPCAESVWNVTETSPIEIPNPMPVTIEDCVLVAPCEDAKFVDFADPELEIYFIELRGEMGGWFGWGTENPTIADILRTLKSEKNSTGDSWIEKAWNGLKDTIGAIKGTVEAAGAGAEIVTALENTVKMADEVVVDDVIGIINTVSGAANTATLLSILDRLYWQDIKMTQLFHILRGGSTNIPDSIIEALRGTTPASETRNVIDSQPAITLPDPLIVTMSNQPEPFTIPNPMPVTVENFPEQQPITVDIPPYPTSIEVSNFPEQQQITVDIPNPMPVVIDGCVPVKNCSDEQFYVSGISVIKNNLINLLDCCKSKKEPIPQIIQDDFGNIQEIIPETPQATGKTPVGKCPDGRNTIIIDPTKAVELITSDKWTPTTGQPDTSTENTKWKAYKINTTHWMLINNRRLKIITLDSTQREWLLFMNNTEPSSGYITTRSGENIQEGYFLDNGWDGAIEEGDYYFTWNKPLAKRYRSNWQDPWGEWQQINDIPRDMGWLELCAIEMDNTQDQQPIQEPTGSETELNDKCRRAQFFVGMVLKWYQEFLKETKSEYDSWLAGLNDIPGLAFVAAVLEDTISFIGLRYYDKVLFSKTISPKMAGFLSLFTWLANKAVAFFGDVNFESHWQNAYQMRHDFADILYSAQSPEAAKQTIDAMVDSQNFGTLIMDYQAIKSLFHIESLRWFYSYDGIREIRGAYGSLQFSFDPCIQIPH